MAALACRTSLSTAGGTTSSPHWTRRSSNSGTKGCKRWGPMWPAASHNTAAAAADLGAVPTGAAAARIASRAARRAPQQADDRFAMQLRHRHDLIEQGALVCPARELSIALALADSVLPKAEGRHGLLLRGVRCGHFRLRPPFFGNRSFAVMRESSRRGANALYSVGLHHWLARRGGRVGLRQPPAKRLQGQNLCPGFESRPLRQVRP